MSVNNSSDTGHLPITIYPSKSTSKSNATGTYYNSMDYTNHNYGSNGKNSENCENNTVQPQTHEIKLYKKRYIMLFLASFCSLMNGLPQFQYTVVADLMACYYGVKETLVDWTCMVYMAAFLPFVFPVMYFMDTKGLRYTVLIGALLNVIGGWIQCASFATDRFMVIMTSQTVYAIGQVFILSLPPFISGIWFGATEVGLACALGVFGNQLGIATGFMIPPFVIDNNCTHIGDISKGLSVIAYPVAVVNTALFVILIFVFQDSPEHFPSVAQATKKSSPPPNYLESLKSLFKDVPFLLVFCSYGLITGTYFAMSTIMNQMVLIHFEGAEVDAGWMGAIMVFAGMGGSLLLGSVQDRTHRFKEISVFTFVISLILMIIYTLLIIYDTEMWVQFLFFGLLGFFTAGYLPVGFDFAAEITYPESEAMSGSLLNASCQLFSISITYFSSKLIEEYGDTASNIFLCGCLLLGTIITACIKVELKRSNTGAKEPTNSLEEVCKRT